MILSYLQKYGIDWYTNPFGAKRDESDQPKAVRGLSRDAVAQTLSRIGRKGPINWFFLHYEPSDERPSRGRK